MNPFARDDTKKTDLRPDPLCLFCFPDDFPTRLGRKTYIHPLPKKEPNVRISNRETLLQGKSTKPEDERTRQREEFWLRKRTEARIRRRRMKEPIKNLKSYLLTSVKNENVPQKTDLPSLFEVLETVKDAWSSPTSRNISLLRDDQKPPDTQQETPQPSVKDSQPNLQFSNQLINRRFSMPEELMRKYFVSKDISEESETNKTMIEITSSSSSTIEQEETARRKLPDSGNLKSDSSIVNLETVRLPEMTDASQQTEVDEKLKTTKVPVRVTQNDYYSQGKRILKVKAVEKEPQVGTCTCRSEKVSSATVSAKEETDSSGTSDSIPSSSPTQLPKRESSSGNLSSESDYIRCTCAELSSSKETSTDLFHSGKSTLSQTVSDKSISTQDSTVSINSVSTRGSTVSDNYFSTTPEIDKTSAKETTTSPDYSPRTPRNNMNRKSRRRDKLGFGYQDYKKTCTKYNDFKHSRNFLSVNYTTKCPVHSESQIKTTVSCGTNTEPQNEPTEAKKEVDVPQCSQIGQSIIKNNCSFTENPQPQKHQPFLLEQKPDMNNRPKLSQEELYMMQQLRHKKFVENRRDSFPVSNEPNMDNAGSTETENSTKNTDYIDQPILIPRYSALPRTLSMVVNTSSGDNSVHNSDSDNQSLADSLEDQPTTHIHKLYYDTKKESKPVRGDVNLVADNKHRHRQPRGKAFFISIKDPFGEDEMLEKIEKIPQPPEKIKNQIFERHLQVCAKHKQRHKTEQTTDGKKSKNEKKRKTRKMRNEESETKQKHSNKNQELKKTGNKTQKKQEEKENQETISEKKTRLPADGKTAECHEEQKLTSKRKRDMKDQKAHRNSKIPVLISSRSTSSSPERDLESKNRLTVKPKLKLRREKETKEEDEKQETLKEATESTEVETTQILEITQAGRELSLQKPQAVIHPSQVPSTDFKLTEKDQLTIPPLVSQMNLPISLRQSWQRQFLLTQVRRSPITKFRQRFEVIPEEKSSSLSSAEEKTAKEPSAESLLNGGQKCKKIPFQSINVNEVSDLIVARITNKELETLPYVKNDENQKIILFSSESQNSNSSKGRDALIAMNREDFNRLAKGWMNFYKLNETLENSENEESAKQIKPKELAKLKEKNTQQKEKQEEEKTKNTPTTKHNQIQTNGLVAEELSKSNKENTNGNGIKTFGNKDNVESDKCLTKNEGKKQLRNSRAQTDVVQIQNELELKEDVKFHSSNTILRTMKKISPENSGRSDKNQTTLPKIKVPQQRNSEFHKLKSLADPLPKVSTYLEDDTDSDSTDYLEPPSPRVPPLPLADFPSDATISSSDSELDDHKTQISNQSMKYFQIKKRKDTNRAKQKKENSFETWRFGKKKNSGWSVTVAGTVEMSRSAPDLEMRLSFPMKEGPPVVSQSDSGFAEDSNYSKLSESLRDLDFYSSRKDQPLGSGNLKQQWKVKVKNPQKGNLQELKPPKNFTHRLPDLESSHNKNSKKVLKEPVLNEKMKKAIEKKILMIWPKVQDIIKSEFLTESGRLVMELDNEITEDFCLSVRGSAVSLERKQKPPTMTERDVTRRYTSRDT